MRERALTNFAETLRANIDDPTYDTGGDYPYMAWWLSKGRPF